MRRTVQEVDPELERRVRCGDRQAFEVLTEKYYATILRVTNRLIHDHHLAQDLAQEALLRAFLRLGRLRVYVPFVALVCRIARNIAIDVLRRRRLGLPQSFETVSENDMPQYVAEGPPEPDHEREARTDAMWGAVTGLRPSERGVLLLRYARGLDLETIATEFGITLASAKARLYRGRRDLAARLAPNPTVPVRGTSSARTRNRRPRPVTDYLDSAKNG